MINPESFKDTLFEKSETDFNEAALALFHYQAEACAPYRRFLNGLRVSASEINHWSKIPHLPIEAFKKHKVISGENRTEIIFTSSGTTGTQTSRHHVKSLEWYHRVFKRSFQNLYPPATDYKWLCLLPGYLERKGSSLVEMASVFIKESKYPGSGFYLNNHAELHTELQKEKAPIILLGVSFALLDFAEYLNEPLPEHVFVMETGGMKGKRKELVREELHSVLNSTFKTSSIHSEYGMTELLSQAYSQGQGLYTSPPWMRISLRDPADPLSPVKQGKTGGINVIDLANVDSCAFIATQDLGRLYSETTFEVLGRFDDSDIRGCNLMAQ